MSLTRRCPGDGEHILIRRCMAITLRPSTDPGQEVVNSGAASGRQDSFSRTDCAPVNGVCEGPGPPVAGGKCPGSSVFEDFVKENADCYWNPTLVQSVNNLEYKGCISPCTVLVSGTEYDLEVVRSAWARRLLRPPNGYVIGLLGDVDPVKMKIVPQTQFAPLPEALCKVVYDLNMEGTIANMAVIESRLKTTFPEILLPEEDILYRTLGSLIRERKLYHTGNGYSVVTPETFRLLAISPPLERQMLLTNDEAIVRLHGTSAIEGRSACTQTNQHKDTGLTSWSSAERILSPTRTPTANGKLKRSHSLKLLRSKDKDKLSRTNSFKASRACPVFPGKEVKSDIENVDPNKKEKSPSMFSKLFRRGRAAEKKATSPPKCSSISSQFPPRDRSDPDFVFYNSRATQTLDSDDQVQHRSYKLRSSSLGRMAGKDRHSQYLTSTPATPKQRSNRSSYHQLTDIYHYRSSSVPRKSSPSPKRNSATVDSIYANSARKQSPKPPTRQRQRQPQSSLPPAPSSRVPNGNFSKTRPKYESVFSPIAKSDEVLLRAGDKYGDETSGSANGNNLWPWRPTSVLATRPSQSLLSRCYQNGSLPWRAPNLLNSQPRAYSQDPMKPQPIVGVPQRVFSRDMASIPPSARPPLAKPENTDDITQGISKNDGLVKKSLHVGGNVDVQISVGRGNDESNHPRATSEGQLKKDSLKVDATWNQLLTNKTSAVVEVSSKNGPSQSLSTVTNITATVSHSNSKCTPGAKTVEVTCPSEDKGQTKSLKSTTVVDCTGKCTIVSELQNAKPQINRDTVTGNRSQEADDKRDFFTQSPSPSEPPGSKDDSGFSSSASTSRPMSVSPC